MLAAQGIITDEECAAICNGLTEIKQEITSGLFTWSNGLEDVHMNIEHALTSASAMPVANFTPLEVAMTR